jgi:hypothetical protein
MNAKLFTKIECAFSPLDACKILVSVLVWLALNQFHASGQGITSVGHQQSRPLHVRFSGEQPRPLSMVVGDFDEDGVDDLVIGYGLRNGGNITFLRGNLDAHAPQTHASWIAASHHVYSAPFLQSSKPVPLTLQPTLLIKADVNGDGHLDLVYATKGSNQVNVIFGDGKGSFSKPVRVAVSGNITALAAYRPGVPLLGEAIIAAYRRNQSAKISILSYKSNIWTRQATYRLPNTVTAMTVANLDADRIPDTAMIAGGQLLILHGRHALSGRASITTVPVSDAESVATGEFLFDRHAQQQLSVMTSNGDVVILAHEGFDPRPYTSQEIAETRLAQRRSPSGGRAFAQQASNNGKAPWIEIERDSAAAVHSASGRPPVIVRTRSGAGFDDVSVFNSSQQQQTLIRHLPAVSPRSLRSTQSLPSTRVVSHELSANKIIAAVSARVSPDAREGMVILNADNVSPEITLPSAGNTFFVNTTADNTGTTTDPSDGTRCTEGSSETCTLRDAITFADNDGPDNIDAGTSDTIMVPAGTYNLTWQAGSKDSNDNLLTHLEIFAPMTLVGSTSGGGVIIDGNNNDTVFSINPGVFGSFSNSQSYVFDLALENLTIQNGKNANNPNDPNAPQGAFINSFGGCINWDADGSGNLTITSSTIKNCTILWGAGGGIWAINSNNGGPGTLTLSGDTIVGNSTPEEGGGVEITSAPVAVAATNTVISGNTANVNVNLNDPAAFGEGGGLDFAERLESSGTPQSTLTNVTVTSNIAAQGNGGGIATVAGLLISSSIFQSNSAGNWGGGIFSEVQPPESETTITSSNFLSNFATEAGGAISGGVASMADGNILQVGLSRIVGNTSTNGAGGVAAGAPNPTSDPNQMAGEIQATENWWGCNGGPNTTGCDQAVLYDSSTGSLTTDPYAQLGFTSDVTTIPRGGSMNLTVSMNTDSGGNPISGAFPAVANDEPYTFNVTGVTANPPLAPGTFDMSGVGTAVLTPSTFGPGEVTVTFDNQTDTIDFTAQSTATTSLVISGNPSLTYLYGQPAGISVQLSPSDATGITTSDFGVTVDGSSTGYSLSLISNNNYQISGPFDALSQASHTLTVSFAGTADFAMSSTSALVNVSAGTVTISDTVTPSKPVQGQGGTVNVTVAGVGTGAVPTGSITYAFNGGATQSATLSGGTAGIAIPVFIPTGSNSLSLAYSGDGNYAPASTSATLTIFGKSQTTFASLAGTSAQINVFGFGFTAPSGQLGFNNVTIGGPVTDPVTLDTTTAVPSLLPQVTTSTGSNSFPVWTELADLNGDGVMDLVTSVFGTDSVTVQLGNGDGTFGAANSILIASGFGPAEVHAVGLRGNRTLDLIVGSFNTNQIAVLLGNSDGTFQPPVFYAVGSAVNTPTSLTTGDFNNDGNLDVATANTGDNTVSVLIGDGSGGLTPLGADINVGAVPQAIRAGDFTGDGFSDLAVANYHDGTVSLLLNNQDETFTPSTVGVGTGPQALAITGNGVNQLLAVANFGGNNVSVLRNNGSGVFEIETTVIVGKGPDEVRFTDINGDSIPDLIVANYTDGTLNMAVGSVGGAYTVLGPFTIGTKPYSAAAGDLNADGTPDIVVANCFSNNTGVLIDGTQISVPYTGLTLPGGNTFNAAYTPDGNSKYGGSTSPNVTVP